MRNKSDIVSKEIEHQRKKKQKHILVGRQECSPPDWFNNDSGYDRGVNRPRSCLLLDRKFRSADIDDVRLFPVGNSDDEISAQRRYGYSDSEDSVSASLPPRPSCSTEGFNDGAGDFPSFFPHERIPRQRRRSTAEKQKFQGTTSGNFRQSSQLMNESAGRIAGGASGSAMKCEKLPDFDTRESTTSDRISSSLTHNKIRELVSENVSLHRIVEENKDSLKQLEDQYRQGKLNLLDAMAEKHQRRILLIQQEFDFRLAAGKEQAEKEMDEMSKEKNQMSEKIKELQQRIVELVSSERLAHEKARNEERKAELESKQVDSLKSQVTAALSTVSQFSEKNLEMVKEIEVLKSELEMKHHLEKRVADVEELYSVLKIDYEKLSEQHSERTAELEQVQDEKQKRAAEIHGLSKEVLEKEDDLTKLKSRCLGLEAQLQTQTSEYDTLRQRHAECLEAARCSWEEVSQIQKEEAFLRQRLVEQELAMEQLKSFARKHYSAVALRIADLGDVKNPGSKLAAQGKCQPTVGEIPATVSTDMLLQPCIRSNCLQVTENGKKLQNEQWNDLRPAVSPYEILARLDNTMTCNEGDLTQQAPSCKNVDKLFSLNSQKMYLPKSVSPSVYHSVNFPIDDNHIDVDLERNVPNKLQQEDFPFSPHVNIKAASKNHPRNSPTSRGDTTKEGLQSRHPPSEIRINMDLGSSSATTTASATPIARCSTAESTGRRDCENEFPVDWSRLSCHKMSNEQESMSVVSSGTSSSSSSRHSGAVSFPRVCAPSSTRLVKVVSECGQCRYELQSFTRA